MPYLGFSSGTSWIPRPTSLFVVFQRLSFCARLNLMYMIWYTWLGSCIHLPLSVVIPHLPFLQEARASLDVWILYPIVPDIFRCVSVQTRIRKVSSIYEGGRQTIAYLIGKFIWCIPCSCPETLLNAFALWAIAIVIDVTQFFSLCCHTKRRSMWLRVFIRGILLIVRLPGSHQGTKPPFKFDPCFLDSSNRCKAR